MHGTTTITNTGLLDQIMIHASEIQKDNANE